MSEKCKSAIAYKHACVNTAEYESACAYSSFVLEEEFKVFVLKIKGKMLSLRRGSKSYWKLVKKLMLGSGHKLFIPCLIKDGETARSGYDKAVYFAGTFQRKWQVPPLEENLYSLEPTDLVSSHSTLLQLRSRDAFYFLSSSCLDNATSPDGVSTILLRNIAATICFGFALLARRILDCGWWPSC